MKYERLTKRNKYGEARHAIPLEGNFLREISESAEWRDSKVLNRLCEIEDKIEQGELLELVCKKSDKVYQTDGVRVYELTVLSIRVYHNKLYYETEGVSFDNTAIGSSIFLTREEAEKRLKELQNG